MRRNLRAEVDELRRELALVQRRLCEAERRAERAEANAATAVNLTVEARAIAAASRPNQFAS